MCLSNSVKSVLSEKSLLKSILNEASISFLSDINCSISTAFNSTSFFVSFRFLRAIRTSFFSSIFLYFFNSNFSIISFNFSIFFITTSLCFFFSRSSLGLEIILGSSNASSSSSFFFSFFLFLFYIRSYFLTLT